MGDDQAARLRPEISVNTKYLHNKTTPKKHSARKRSGVKCRENGSKCVRVIAVKCVVDFIRSSGFTTFKYLQSLPYIIRRNVQCHSRVINPFRRDGSGKERGGIVGTGKKMNYNTLVAVGHFVRKGLGPVWPG